MRRASLKGLTGLALVAGGLVLIGNSLLDLVEEELRRTTGDRSRHVLDVIEAIQEGVERHGAA